MEGRREKERRTNSTYRNIHQGMYMHVGSAANRLPSVATVAIRLTEVFSLPSLVCVSSPLSFPSTSSLIQ